MVTSRASKRPGGSMLLSNTRSLIQTVMLLHDLNPDMPDVFILEAIEPSFVIARTSRPRRT